jgi:hypothetical protein
MSVPDNGPLISVRDAMRVIHNGKVLLPDAAEREIRGGKRILTILAGNFRMLLSTASFKAQKALLSNLYSSLTAILGVSKTYELTKPLITHWS